MRSVYLLILFISIQSFYLNAQNNPVANPDINVQKYVYQIAVNDSTDVIRVIADVEIHFNKALKEFSLDLVQQNKTKRGMLVESVLIGRESVQFSQNNDKLIIKTDLSAKNQLKKFRVSYHGIPKDGLIISNNKFGDRTFFGDNWPNRAHNWLVCVDHPMDKALVEFRVTAPEHYKVIANGTLKGIKKLDGKTALTIWKTDVVLPVKVMVIGVARFAVEETGEIDQIPVSSWVFPQNKKEGFYDYAPARVILGYFIEHVGPYPFSKLANVQSKTRYGGMENASCIFYYEESVTGKRKSDNLLIHEIAHQWFGDSATETDWQHLWLSEGFATYFTDLYIEDHQGEKAFRKRMTNQRTKIIRFSENWKIPVIDTVTTNLIKRLNANSYEKGAWVLHMLRRQIGDKNFWKAVRKYYKTYTLKNASTEDLKKIFEEVSGKQLDTFFNQWLYQSGQPTLKTSWEQKGKNVYFHLEQTQKDFPEFNFPLEIRLNYEDGTSETKTILVNQKIQDFKLKATKKADGIIIDPDIWLLYKIFK